MTLNRRSGFPNITNGFFSFLLYPFIRCWRGTSKSYDLNKFKPYPNNHDRSEHHERQPAHTCSTYVIAGHSAPDPDSAFCVNKPVRGICEAPRFVRTRSVAAYKISRQMGIGPLAHFIQGEALRIGPTGFYLRLIVWLIFLV